MGNKTFAFTAINCRRNYIASQVARDGTVTIFPILNVYCILCMALCWLAIKASIFLDIEFFIWLMLTIGDIKFL